MMPDPLGGDTLNPQSLNRYAYVLNNPTTLTDPLGPCAGCKLLEVGYADLGDEFNDIFNYDSEGDLWFGTPVSWTGSPAAYPGPGGGGGGAPPKPNIVTWPQLQKLVHENNESNFCDDLIDCIVFKESHLGASGVPSGVDTGFNTLAGLTVHSALGLMQLEPCNKEGPCVGTYHPFNPAENIQIGSAFLQEKIDQLGVRGGVASYGTGADYASEVLNCLKLLQAGNVGDAYAAATKP